MQLDRLPLAGTWDPGSGAGSVLIREASGRAVVLRLKTVTAVLDYDGETSELLGINVVVGPYERKDA